MSDLVFQGKPIMVDAEVATDEDPWRESNYIPFDTPVNRLLRERRVLKDTLTALLTTVQHIRGCIPDNTHVVKMLEYYVQNIEAVLQVHPWEPK